MILFESNHSENVEILEKYSFKISLQWQNIYCWPAITIAAVARAQRTKKRKASRNLRPPIYD